MKHHRLSPYSLKVSGVKTSGFKTGSFKVGSFKLGGFTLIEVLVAMFLLAIIGTAGFKMLQRITSARISIEEHSDRITELQRTFYWLAEDVTQIVDRPVRSSVGSQLPAFQVNLQGASLIDFTRAGWANPAGDILPARSTLQRVSYAIEDDKLFRSYWYHLDSLEETPTKRRQLLTGVEELTLRFMGPDGAWESQWPPLNVEEDPGLPRALEFTLMLDDYGKVVRVFGLPG